ncbi:hypothetical protein TNCV_874621 [Trichonephila clavipes]|nr:hypothetical protein TNCV_874621 [Trichonephila clavipes]
MRPGSTTTSQKQSKQWVEAGVSAPKKRRLHLHGRSWPACSGRRNIYIERSCYLKKGKPIRSEYYSNPLDQLDAEI